MFGKKLFFVIIVFIIFFLNYSFLEKDKSFKSISEALNNREYAKLLEINTCSDSDYYLYDSIYKLKNLKTLKISECPKISNLPKNIEQLKLTHLEFFWNGIGNCKIDYSKIGNITSLQFLKLGPYSCLKQLPTSFKKLNKLEYLDVQLTDIREIPLWINELHNLKFLDISLCSGIDSLPVSSLNMMGNLKVIKCYDSKFTRDSMYMIDVSRKLRCKIKY
jgi:Leucine-rich repeat (LRR) protein